MSEAADLVEWLLTTAANSDNPKHFAPRLRQAADLIVSQEAEIAKLREALKPFAEKLGYILVPADDQDVSPWTTAPDATPVINFGSYGLTFGDFRRASLALSENSDDKG